MEGSGPSTLHLTTGLTNEDFVQLTKGRHLFAVELPPLFLMNLIAGSARLSGLNLPADVLVYLVLSNTTIYPGCVMVLLESLDFPVVVDRVPCVLIAPGDEVTGEPPVVPRPS